ncbi:MAG: hypothetical protein JWM33_918 [Caulobacteraceae bacterium]|jgi:hypothetical protein|nr:hypothetical protein [Caulobacteraceae bacterium]
MPPADASWTPDFTGSRVRPGRVAAVGLLLATAISVGLWVLIIAALRVALS